MKIDFHEQSKDLLEVLANSIHDREPKSLTPFCFSSVDLSAAEVWLKNFADEIKLIS